MCTQHTACLPLFVTLGHHQRFWHFTTDSHPHVPVGLVMGFPLGFYDFLDVIFSICQQWMSEAKQDAIEAEHDGEERGIPAL